MQGSDDDVRILADINIGGSLTIEQVTEFPEDAKVVTFIVKDGILYGYLNVQGITAWCPFARIPTNYVYKQLVTSDEWIIIHNLGTLDTWIQVKDTNGLSIPFSQHSIDKDTVSLRFLQGVIGSALIISNDIPQIS